MKTYEEFKAEEESMRKQFPKSKGIAHIYMAITKEKQKYTLIQGANTELDKADFDAMLDCLCDLVESCDPSAFVDLNFSDNFPENEGMCISRLVPIIQKKQHYKSVAADAAKQALEISRERFESL